MAHSWYDYSCCSDIDCAPVIRKEDHSEIGQVYIWTKMGKTRMPYSAYKDAKPSKDGDEHVCMDFLQPASDDGFRIFRCIYVPAGS